MSFNKPSEINSYMQMQCKCNANAMHLHIQMQCYIDIRSMIKKQSNKKDLYIEPERDIYKRNL